MPEHLLWWSLCAVLLFWAVGAYNRLVRLRSEALRTFVALGLSLQTITEHVASSAPTLLGTTLAGAASLGAADPASARESIAPKAPAEPATPALPQWAGLQGAAAQFAASLAVARIKPLDAEAMAALSAASAVLRMAWQRTVDECKALSLTALPDALLAHWDEVNRQADHAAEDFALTVQTYNAAVAQFPAALLAWVFGFRKAQALSLSRP